MRHVLSRATLAAVVGVFSLASLSTPIAAAVDPAPVPLAGAGLVSLAIGAITAAVTITVKAVRQKRR